MCGLVGVLKPSPPANIENQNGVKSTLSSKRVAEKLLKRFPAFFASDLPDRQIKAGRYFAFVPEPETARRLSEVLEVR